MASQATMQATTESTMDADAENSARTGFRVIAPVAGAAWLSGSLAPLLGAELSKALPEGAKVTLLPRAFLIEDCPLEPIRGAMLRLERVVWDRFPEFRHEMGPVGTDTLQVVYDDAETRAA